MPELPEVQAHAERLSAAFGGVQLARFDALSFTALKTFDPPPDAGVGRILERVDRRGKYLLLRMAELTYVVHLMQGGRLREDAGTGAARRRGGGKGATRIARWGFADDRSLLLTEAGTERRAGVWVVAGDPLAREPLAALGDEADAVDDARMVALLGQHSMRLHTFLRDQRVIAGVGRRLANEVCHRAGLSPFALTSKLDVADAARVTRAIRETVDEGLAAERARPDMSASKERPGAVHGRAGEDCPLCGDTVRSVEYRDYTVSYCPSCQTGGKVLADNTTSKFLK